MREGEGRGGEGRGEEGRGGEGRGGEGRGGEGKGGEGRGGGGEGRKKVFTVDPINSYCSIETPQADSSSNKIGRSESCQSPHDRSPTCMAIFFHNFSEGPIPH